MVCKLCWYQFILNENTFDIKISWCINFFYYLHKISVKHILEIIQYIFQTGHIMVEANTAATILVTYL